MLMLRNGRPRVLVVDDDREVGNLLCELLGEGYDCTPAASAEQALARLEQAEFDLVLSDIQMPGMSGLEMIPHVLAKSPNTVVVMVSGMQTIESAVVRSITDALEAKDEHLYGHARRVSGYSLATGRRLRLDTAALEHLALASALHDIGKIGTPDAVLLKAPPLGEDECALMRLHPERGARMLAGVPEMEEVAAAVRHHHEHWNGTGYPSGLAGEQIPLASRIILLTDAYDVMTSPRPFREALDHEAAIARIREEAGRQFDPEVVRAFCELETLARIRGAIAEAARGRAPWLSSGLPAGACFLPAADLVAQVIREPALAACALREANAVGACATADLEEACARLGEARLRPLVSRVGETSRPRLDADIFREHSLRCAVAARLLAEQTKVLAPGDAYTLGLLHDVGELLLCALFPEEMENLLWLGEDERLEREVATFGVDHAQVGQWALEALGLPHVLGALVQMHHDALRVNSPAALLLHVADAIAGAESLSDIATLDALGSDQLALLRLSRADLARIHERTAETVEGRWVVNA